MFIESDHMPTLEKEDLSKLYYTIGEVADMFGVSTSLIRFWEGEFQFLKPHKNSKGDRRFTKQNIEQVQLIYHLVKEKGFTLDGAKKEIKENRAKLIAKTHLIKSLTDLRAKLIDLKNRAE